MSLYRSRYLALIQMGLHFGLFFFTLINRLDK